MRLVLAWASVASVAMWLPVGIATAYAWLARQDLSIAPQSVQNLATAWLIAGGAYPAVSTLAVLLAWHYHRKGNDAVAGRWIAVPGLFVATIFTLGVITVGVSRDYIH